jgi:hypothetical protein
MFFLRKLNLFFCNLTTIDSTTLGVILITGISQNPFIDIIFYLILFNAIRRGFEPLSWDNPLDLTLKLLWI